MDSLLTGGVINNIFTGTFPAGTSFVVRVLSKCMISNGNVAKKARLKITDGQSESNSVMCSGNLESKVSNLQEGSMIEVTKWSLNNNPQNQQQVLIVLDLKPLQPQQTQHQFHHLPQQQQHQYPPGPQQQYQQQQHLPRPQQQRQYPPRHAPVTSPYFAAAAPTPAPAPNAYTHPKSDSVNSIPINVLNPYLSSWTITARVVSKSDMRHWSNGKSSNMFLTCML